MSNMSQPDLVAGHLKRVLGPVEHVLRIEQARAEIIALGAKYKGAKIPTNELFKFMEIDGLLDSELRRNLKYVQIGNGLLTEEEIVDLEKEDINRINLFVDPRGWTPICRAIRQDSASMIDRILAHPHFDPNVRNQDDLHPATPLMIAAEHRPQYLERILASPRIDADLVDSYGCSSLAIVLQFNPHYLPVMLASGKVSLNKRNCKASSALTFAVQMCTPRELTLLLQNGASVKDYDAVEPILISLMTCNYDMLPILVEFGARLPIKYVREQVRRGTIVLNRVGKYLLSSGLFTEDQLKREFSWSINSY